MQRDGVALVKFLKWLEDAVPTGRETEISIDRKLHAFRAAQPLYMGESFDTIAGYKEHGAIVHYEATPETDVTLKAEGFLLLDSGANIWTERQIYPYHRTWQLDGGRENRLHLNIERPYRTGNGGIP